MNAMSAPSLFTLQHGRAPDAPVSASMSVTDARGERHASPTAFMQELVDFVNGWWRERGQRGCTVAFASYADDVATIETRPGTVAITVADVREAALKRKEAA